MRRLSTANAMVEGAVKDREIPTMFEWIEEGERVR